MSVKRPLKPEGKPKLIVPPEGLYIKRHKVRLRVIERQKPPTLPPETLEKYHEQIVDGIRLNSAGIDGRESQWERKRTADLEIERGKLLEQIRSVSKIHVSTSHRFCN